MRLEWLEDILAVAETGSFSEAAERRGLTQSAFSRRIRLIEERVGVALFDRARKPVALCPTTAAQRDRIAALAEDLRGLQRALREGADSAGHRLVIAGQHTLSAVLAPSLVEAVRAADPQIRCELVSDNLDACLALLLARRADLALLYRVPGEAHPVQPDFVDIALLGEDRLVPVFAGREIEIERLPCVVYPRDVFLGEVLERRVMPGLRDRGAPTLRAETAFTHAALEMARAGIGVAWVPRALAAGLLARGEITDLSDRLASIRLEVTALRLRAAARDAVDLAWTALPALSGPGTRAVPGAPD